MHPYRALFEQSSTPLFMVERSAHEAMNVYANAAFRHAVGWVDDNSDMALASCFPLDVNNVLAAVYACDQQQTVQELMVTWADASRRWQLQLSPVVEGEYRAVYGALHELVLPFGESLDALLSQLPGFIYQLHYSLSGHWRYTYVGQRVEEMFGVSVEEALADAQTLLANIHPGDRDTVIASSLESARTLTPGKQEFRMFHRHGEMLWVEASDQPRREPDGSVLWTGYANDITQRKALEAALKSSEQRFRQLVEQANDIIYTLDADGMLTYISPNWPRILGHEVNEVLGRHMSFVLHPEDLEACRRYIENVFVTAEPQGLIEYRVQHANGEWRWHFTNGAPLLDEQGNVISFMGISHDITPRHEMEQRVLHLAQHDTLTDLPNRAMFFGELTKALRSGGQLAFLFIDLDNFKPVNDRWGHAVGDQLLKAAAQRMRARLRGTDMVGRIGGDEFVALLGGSVMKEDALAVAHQLCSGLAEPFALLVGEVCVSASIGVALFPLHAKDEATLIHCADQAMYRAKAEGRNRAILYSACESGKTAGVASTD
nr:sensor domain-containing diguanylate cyclase [uncultured Halomonas sp.]